MKKLTAVPIASSAKAAPIVQMPQPTCVRGMQASIASHAS
jgi:hypothetical protein